MNLDAKPEFINMQISIPVKADETITSIKFLPFFAVNLTQMVQEDFSSLVYLQYDSPVAGLLVS